MTTSPAMDRPASRVGSRAILVTPLVMAAVVASTVLAVISSPPPTIMAAPSGAPTPVATRIAPPTASAMPPMKAHCDAFSACSASSSTLSSFWSRATAAAASARVKLMLICPPTPHWHLLVLSSGRAPSTVRPESITRSHRTGAGMQGAWVTAHTPKGMMLTRGILSSSLAKCSS